MAKVAHYKNFQPNFLNLIVYKMYVIIINKEKGYMGLVWLVTQNFELHYRKIVVWTKVSVSKKPVN